MIGHGNRISGIGNKWVGEKREDEDLYKYCINAVMPTNFA
jgi:hypothetical protein